MELNTPVSVRPEDAHQLIKTLFNPTDYLTISGKKAQRVVGQNVYTQAAYAPEMIAHLTEETLLSMCTDPEKMDIYFGISPITPETYRGVNKRTKEEDVRHIIMLYADLDVKAGSFISTEDAWTFLVSLDIVPNVIVGSGSGGLHAYWRLSEPVDVVSGKNLMVRWWAYLADKAGDRKIDKLVDTTRMSRLPGSIRWPKEGTDETPKPVRLLWASRAGSADPETVLSLSEQPWAAVLKRREETRRKDSDAVREISAVIGKGGWSERLAIASMEQWVSSAFSWESLLAPKGWTFLRTDGAGRDEWARPGQGGKSCVVNWPESPDVMSLLSTSEETGLSDLLDAGVVLTKWRVLVRLWFNDDVAAATQWVLDIRSGV